jgi:predicted secreted Zn-dependent protease
VNRSGRIAAAVALAVAGVASTVRAEVVESLEEVTYTAHALRGQSLREALDAATPIRQDGKIFHGHTRWHIRWSFRWWREGDGRCRITANTTNLDLAITLPRLGSGGGDLHRQFRPFREALHAHELGHARIAREAAQAIDRAILDLPEMASCTSLEAAAQRVAETLLADAERAQKRFDRDTEHGRRDGARVD